ncbi:MAG: ion transporter [Bacteroidia bacterium]|nr:ion transporter [Bacteroidia bacterium]
MYRIFLNERIIFPAIFVNLLVLFLLSFSSLQAYYPLLEYIDHLLTIFFLFEMIIKVRLLGWPVYIQSSWNRLDFVAVVLTVPSLILYFFQIPHFPLLHVFRSLRVIKFLRFLRFVPRFEFILEGLIRSLKASLLVLVAFFLYNTVVSLFNCYLFREVAPQHFGNALRSFYTTFRMFTLDGWNENSRTYYPTKRNQRLYFCGRVLLCFPGIKRWDIWPFYRQRDLRG